MCIFFSFLLSDARTCLHVFVGVKWKASRGAFHVYVGGPHSLSDIYIYIHVRHLKHTAVNSSGDLPRTAASRRPAFDSLCSLNELQISLHQKSTPSDLPLTHASSPLYKRFTCETFPTHTHTTRPSSPQQAVQNRSLHLHLQSTMAKLTAVVVVLLMVLDAATAGAVVTNADGATATVPVPVRHQQQTRRSSRFLLANSSPPSPYYACSKKSAAAVCFAPGSPGATCCGGRCVDTAASADHCGGCSKVCKHDRSTCCGGRCVDLLSDKGNCGACGNLCDKRCSNGFCDYAL